MSGVRCNPKKALVIGQVARHRLSGEQVAQAMSKPTGVAGMPRVTIRIRFQMLVTRMSPIAEPIWRHSGADRAKRIDFPVPYENDAHVSKKFRIDKSACK